MDMNTHVQEYKDNFLKQQQITYRRTYVPDSENEKLCKKYDKSESGREEIKKDFKSEEDVLGRLRFYTEQSETVTDEEISQYISMKIINRLDSLDEKTNTMKNIMIFWVILTIISLISSLYLVSKIASI